MGSVVTINLNLSSKQLNSLLTLQASFAEVCNALTPIVQQTRCWNRVGLHHLAYHSLREKFPQLGSQMICNAIYSVSRTCRQIYQNPSSPYFINKRPNANIPLLKFAATSPVYFDKHTLSIKGNDLSMYTLDGRMRFELNLSQHEKNQFQSEKLREIVLHQSPTGIQLSFFFGQKPSDQLETHNHELPEYIVLITTEQTLPSPLSVTTSNQTDKNQANETESATF